MESVNRERGKRHLWGSSHREEDKGSEGGHTDDRREGLCRTGMVTCKAQFSDVWMTQIPEE